MMIILQKSSNMQSSVYSSKALVVYRIFLQIIIHKIPLILILSTRKEKFSMRITTQHFFILALRKLSDAGIACK
jgi:hypothetical protein